MGRKLWGRNGNKRQEGNGIESEDDKRDECAGGDW